MIRIIALLYYYQLCLVLPHKSSLINESQKITYTYDTSGDDTSEDESEEEHKIEVENIVIAEAVTDDELENHMPDVEDVQPTNNDIQSTNNLLGAIPRQRTLREAAIKSRNQTTIAQDVSKLFYYKKRIFLF